MKSLLLFFLLSFSTLHAQWIMDVGDIRIFYSDPELMKKNKVSRFLPISKAYDKSLPKDLRLDPKWKFKEYFWVNKEGFVFCGGEIFHGDTISFHTFQRMPGDSSQWMMTWDSISVQHERFYLFSKGYSLNKQLTIDNQGRFVSSSYRHDGNLGKYFNSSGWFHYTNHRLDSINYSTGSRQSVSRYQYNDQNQLVQVLYYRPVGYSDSLALESTTTYVYRKDGLLKKVKETYHWKESWWYITRFRWRKG
jgi:hypothetical protein